MSRRLAARVNLIRTESHLKGVFLTSWLQWLRRKQARTEEPWSRATMHRPHECFQAIDLSFRLAVAPRLSDRISHRVDISLRRARKTVRYVAPFFANLPPCVVGMEASNGAHYWANTFSALGHDVLLISPQFVTPYVKSNKNDRNDAEAICEAVGRPSMRFVPVESAEQLAIQAIHRIRSCLVGNRVRLVNQIRGLLGEHGVVIAQAIGNLRRALPRIVDEESNGLNSIVRELIGELREELIDLDRRIAIYDRKIRQLYRTSEACRRLGMVEGIGPVTATALVAAAGDGNRSRMVGNLRHGSDLCRDNGQVEADRVVGRASAASAIFELVGRFSEFE